MPLGFGDNVARLSATLTLDDDGFIRGMADASAKLDAYNAKLKEEGVGKRFATMASREYARQLYNEARQVDQTTASHNRLLSTLQAGQRHWKLLSVGAAGAGLGIVALTGHLGALTGLLGQLGTAAIPAFSAALTGLLSPFTALAAVAVGLAGPLSALTVLFGAFAGAGFLGVKTALQSHYKGFDKLHDILDKVSHSFGNLGMALAHDFMPYIIGGANWILKFLHYANQLAHMSLPQAIRSIAHEGMAMLQHLNRAIYDAIGKPLLTIFTASFGKAGNRISHAFAHIIDVWRPLVSKMWGVFTSWFDKQHFERTGATWAAAIVNTALPVIAKGFLGTLKSVFENTSFWGKVGLVAGGAFAANFFTAGMLGKGILAGGKGLIGLLGGGAAAGGAAGAGGGVAAGGGGLIAGVSASAVAPIALALVPIVAGAAAAYFLGKAQGRPAPTGPGGITPSRGSSGSSGFDVAGYAKATAALKKLADEQKQLNQFISDGGKSVKGWKLAVGQATNQARAAEAAIHDMAQKGLVSADQAAQQSKGNLQTYISQEDAIARKATAASGNVAKFGAQTRAQYAHVAALARTSADLAAAINAIPSQKYVSLVLSITENLKTQGLAPGQARSQQGLPSAAGRVVTGGVPGRDSVPILAMAGEVVLSKKAIMQHFGGNPYAADILNMASGGLVPPPRHKKETRNAYRGRVSSWLSQVVAGRQGVLDFNISIADRIAQRDDADGQYAAEIRQLQKEQRYRADEIRLFDRAARVARRFGLLGAARGYRQDAAFIHQDILDTAETIESLKGQPSTTGGGGGSVAAQIAAFLALQQGFISQFASNINLTGTSVATSGTPTTSGGGAAPGRAGRLPNRTVGGGVVIHNHFTQTPPDSFVHIRKARLQAAAVFQ